MPQQEQRMGVNGIRDQFIKMLTWAMTGDLDLEVTDKSGVRMLEIHGVSFVADEDAIFGEPDRDYIQREIDWYNTQSLNICAMKEPIPAIWKMVATPQGFINSNYGHLIYSAQNGYQYEYALSELTNNPETRRAIMIYTRPEIQDEYNTGGMSDFICTNVVQYVIRGGKMHAIVQMRSNDVVFGYRNDLAWQKHVLAKLVGDYNTIMQRSPNFEAISIGDIIWQVGSLHVYERHFPLIQKHIDSLPKKKDL